MKAIAEVCKLLKLSLPADATSTCFVLQDMVNVNTYDGKKSF
jgi:hypothetical protein